MFGLGSDEGQMMVTIEAHTCITSTQRSGMYSPCQTTPEKFSYTWVSMEQGGGDEHNGESAPSLPLMLKKIDLSLTFYADATGWSSFPEGHENDFGEDEDQLLRSIY